ncbi:MAG: NAD(P)H-dependent oxidoreductase [Mucilaginibacter polytrichastri]|nr:NAD(P)H-dependent oxidoreductase [Mucilaginibacter polytrichastri]
MHKLLIIAGTNRPKSNTATLAAYYRKRLAEMHTDAGILSLTELPANIIETDLYGKRSEAFQSIQERVSAAEKFLFLIPEYNGSFPGVLKVFMDACDYPSSFYGKKAALVGHSNGRYGNIRGVDHFTGVCHYMHLNVLSLRIHIPSIRSELDEQANLFKEDTLRYTDEQLSKFIDY